MEFKALWQPSTRFLSHDLTLVLIMHQAHDAKTEHTAWTTPLCYGTIVCHEVE